jgi:uncharacterized protein (DUF983 family)
MEIPRKLGIAIVMIVPVVVSAGMVWAVFESWIPVIVVVILMALLYRSIIKGKMVSVFKKI